MKSTILSVFFLLLFAFAAQAQAPKAFKYQTVVRDAAGQVLANQAVTIGIDLGPSSNFVYSEDHSVTTNQFGLVSLEIGRGTVVGGTFDAVDWSQPTFIRVLLDPTGGNDLQVMGQSELLSVPYALYAANGGGSDADGDPTNEIQVLSQTGADVTLSNGGGTISVNDADADPANEIQTLSQTGADVTLSNGGGTISVNDADADPTNEIEMPADAAAGDIVFYNGTNWQKISAGPHGSVLTMGKDGTPFWDLQPLKVVLPNGDFIYAHPTDNAGGNGTERINWGPINSDIPGLTNIPDLTTALNDFDGEGNTTLIVAALGNYNDPPVSNATSYAAKICDDLVALGFDDWYLPAAGELKAVQEQTNLDVETNYWSSSESNANYAWFYTEGFLGPGFFNDLQKDNQNASFPTKCRCVRK